MAGEFDLLARADPADSAIRQHDAVIAGHEARACRIAGFLNPGFDHRDIAGMKTSVDILPGDGDIGWQVEYGCRRLV